MIYIHLFEGLSCLASWPPAWPLARVRCVHKHALSRSSAVYMHESLQAYASELLRTISCVLNTICTLRMLHLSLQSGLAFSAQLGTHLAVDAMAASHDSRWPVAEHVGQLVYVCGLYVCALTAPGTHSCQQASHGCSMSMCKTMPATVALSFCRYPFL